MASTNIAFKVLLLLCLYAAFTYSRVVYVGSAVTSLTIVVPDNYPTIQAAIDNARDGDTILVKPGTYLERLRIYKSLTVLGSDATSTIIQSPGGGHTVEISPGTNGVTFAGFTLRGKADSWSGIYIIRSLYNNIHNNVIVNHMYGIHIYDSMGNILRNNNLSNNKYNLRVWGLFRGHFLHDIDSSNMVNGKPVYYWINMQNKTVPRDAGFVALVNSSNITVKNLNLSNNFAGILLAYTRNSFIVNVNVSKNERGLYIVSSNNNTIINNNFSDNEWSGISTISSSCNLILLNTISGNGQLGIRLSHAFPLLSYYSDNNVIRANVVENNIDGIYFEKSSNNKVSGNLVVNNTLHGITLDASNGNIFWENTLTNNRYGVWLDGSNNNTFYHNNFVNNSIQVGVYNYSLSVNSWDNGYPSGGNYWSNYNSSDLFSGPYQNEPGGDEIGDNSYIIDANNQDHYPLMNPKALPEIQDIAIVDVSPSNTEVYVGWVVNITVVVKNEGKTPETFTVTCKYKLEGIEYNIGALIVANLPPNTNATLLFKWVTTDIALHAIEAEVNVLPNEIDIFDNIMTSTITVKVKMLGDVNGDDKIDIKDITEAAVAFGSYPEHTRWDPQADINQNKKIDIRDLALIARNFGKTR